MGDPGYEDTARSCGLFPSLWPPLGVIMTVSPRVQIDPSVALAEGLKMKAMFSRKATESWRGLRAVDVMIGPSSPAHDRAWRAEPSRPRPDPLAVRSAAPALP